MTEHTYPYCPAATRLSEDCVCGMIAGGSGTLEDPFQVVGDDRRKQPTGTAPSDTPFIATPPFRFGRLPGGTEMAPQINRCSPERPCGVLNEMHVDMWGECFVSSYVRMVSLRAGDRVVRAASDRRGDYCWHCGIVRDDHGSADHDLIPFPPEDYDETAARPLFLTCWDCGHSVDRKHRCHHCGSKLIRQGGHSLQPWCGCRHDAART